MTATEQLCGEVGTAGYPCTRELNHGDDTGKPTFNRKTQGRHIATHDGVTMQIWEDEVPR